MFKVVFRKYKMEKYVPIHISYDILQAPNGSDANLTAVIFLHGMTCTRANWLDIPQIVANKTKRKVFIYDARNHGKSQYTDEFTATLMIEDLFYFMDMVEVSKAILVGHSMGGVVAAHATLQNPERVVAVVVEDIFIRKIAKELLAPVITYIEMWRKFVRAAPKHSTELEALTFAIKKLRDQFPQDKRVQDSLETLLKTKELIRQLPDGSYDVNYNFDVILKSILDIENFSQEPCGTYNGPALFIFGENSQYSVANEKENIKKHFPRVEFNEFEGATHHVHAEFQEKFVKTLLCHLQKLKM